MGLQVFQKEQSLYKYIDEILFVCLYVLVITINKFVLSELKFTVPTVFQGWQTLSCVILLSLFVKCNKVKSNLQVLDAKAFSLLLPALVCFTLGIVAGSKALAELNVPVFLAISNIYPAILSLSMSKTELNNVSLQICGSTAVLGTVIIIVLCTFTFNTAPSLFWLLLHNFLNMAYYVYLNKLNLDLTNTTEIYYRNFFSIFLLFPISFYLDVLHLPSNRGWEFYLGCFLSGILGTCLQVWTFKICPKHNYLQFEGLAKVLCSLLAYYLFLTNIPNFIWILIIINFLICATFLKTSEKEKISVQSALDSTLLLRPDKKNVDSDIIFLI